jgi:RHS repeat-associated protein
MNCHEGMGQWARLLIMLLMGAFSSTQLHAGTRHYYYTDPQGNVLAKADAQGNIVATYDYAPYGSSVPSIGSPPNGPGYSGHVNDPDTGLIYMQARYYDPVTGRFLSVDPVTPAPGNAFNFNRYGYGNNNPIINIDPDGRSVTCNSTSCTIVAHSVLEEAVGYAYVGGVILQRAVQNAIAPPKTAPVHHSEEAPPSAVQPAPSADGNTNPYDGPVDAPVVVVDKDGNAIPVGAGQRVTTSSSGDYQQVRDRDGKATGDRLDRGGHKTQPDPKAREPHAHRPGVTDPTGNPHLPINPPINPPTGG